MKNSTWIGIIIIVIILAAVISLVPRPAPAPVDTATTTVATPDQNGTTTPTPSGTTTTPAFPVSFSLRLGETKTIGAWSITPRMIAEDSRCPATVKCIQAGTVRVKTDVGMGTTTIPVTITLLTPVSAGEQLVTLTSVEPEKIKPGTISSTDYVFDFKVDNTKQ